MKTLIRMYDPTTKMTLTLCHCPAFDGAIEKWDPYIIKETIEGESRVLDVDYERYMRDRYEAQMTHILKTSRIVFLDMSK